MIDQIEDVQMMIVICSHSCSVLASLLLSIRSLGGVVVAEGSTRVPTFVRLSSACRRPHFRALIRVPYIAHVTGNGSVGAD